MMSILVGMSLLNLRCNEQQPEEISAGLGDRGCLSYSHSIEHMFECANVYRHPFDNTEGAIMTLLHDNLTTVWFEGGVPYGIVWEGRHYRVTDTPTHLDEPHTDLAGWRFQGTDDDETSRMFDIRRRGTNWDVVRVYA
ncbi:MAG: hypothetical protein ACRCSP_02585 [Rhodoglobus sp.]